MPAFRLLRALGAALAWVSVLAFATGCESEVDLSAVSAKVVAFGEFEIRGGIPTLTRETTDIRCELGKIFGVDYRIDVSDGEYGRIPVEFRWVHPELAVPSRGLWGPETPALTPGPELEWRATAVEGRALWSLEHVDELVGGRYEFQIRRLDDGQVILSQGFELEGC